MNEYRDTFASVLRFCRDFSDEMKSHGFDLEVINFDAASSPQMWPNKDVVGVAEFNLELNDGTIEVQTIFAVSTIEDTNNFRMNEIVNYLLNSLLPGSAIKLYDAQTGKLRGRLAIRNGTRAASPSAMKTRAVQPIMVSLLSDQILRS